MKKLFLYFNLIALGVVFFIGAPLTADAALINLSPQTKNVVAGNTFKITIAVDPFGESIFTVKAALSYPADLLRVTSFNFRDEWIPLNQPGFNEINNEKGIIIKTGGYPGGVISQTVLGVITFTGLKEGSATVSLSDDSIILNNDNKNILTNKSATTLTLSPARTGNDKKTVASVKNDAPITKTANDAVVSDRFSDADVKTPNDIPSPEKAWLYTKLAILSIVALGLQHPLIMCLAIGIFGYGLFRIIRKVIRK